MIDDGFCAVHQEYHMRFTLTLLAAFIAREAWAQCPGGVCQPPTNGYTYQGPSMDWQQSFQFRAGNSQGFYPPAGVLAGPQAFQFPTPFMGYAFDQPAFIQPVFVRPRFPILYAVRQRVAYRIYP